MIMTDKQIINLCTSYHMITPYNVLNVQPASYDITLSNEFIYKGKVYHEDSFVLNPNEFMLGTTNEHIRLPPNLVGRVDGKSSLGRIGLLIHATAGFIDPNFKGQITLEMKNIGDKPIRVYAGVRIGQISFEELASLPENVYGDCNNHYQDQEGVTTSVFENKVFNGIYHVTDNEIDSNQTILDGF